MYKLDVKEFIRLGLPPHRRGKGLARLAHVLFRVDETEWLRALEEARLEARFVPQAGVIAARMKRLMPESLRNDPNFVVTVEDNAAGNPLDFKVNFPVPLANVDALQKWLNDHTTAGKRGNITNSAAANPPPAPTNVLYTYREYGTPTASPYVGVSWVNGATADQATGSILEVSTVSNVSGFAQYGTALALTPSVVDYGPLTPGVTYFFRVKHTHTVNGSSTYAYGPAAGFSVSGGGDNTTPPSLNWQRTTGSNFKLLWGYNRQADSFDLHRSLDASGDTFTFYQNVGGGFREAVVSSSVLTRWKIRAKGSGWESNWSLEITVPAPSTGGTGGGGAITLGGVDHHNNGGTVDMGDYNLVWRAMPDSTRFKYTPRMVLKSLTTTGDMQIAKFPLFNLTEKDLVMYDARGVEDFTQLLQKGASHINSRKVFNQNGGSGAVSNPSRPHKDIPWQKRFHMTMSNNFDWIPEFQQGQNLTPAQIESLKGWVTGDGVSNYFTDGQAPQWHLKDWEFQLNGGVWMQLVDHYRAQYGNTRFIMNWMGHGQVGYGYQDKYDAWSIVGYVHLTDWVDSGNRNYSDGDAGHLENWRQLWESDAHNVLQMIGRPEWYSANYPNSPQLHGNMTSYEDGAGGGTYNWAYGNLHPSVAEGGWTWMMLMSRINHNLKGGIVPWDVTAPGRPATTEQLIWCGLRRLAFLNDLRSVPYTIVKPLVSFDGGSTWLEQAVIDIPPGFSSLGVSSRRGGSPANEPQARCLVTSDYVAVFAQNPHEAAPASQTFRIRVPGLIEDNITVWRESKTLGGFAGSLTYKDRELTVAVARR